MSEEIINPEPVEVLDKNVEVLNIDQAEINQQIATAHRFPRSITRFKQKALEMATMDEDTAASCFYVLPRSGKNIEGPSVRLAEITGAAWGNMRYGARIIAEDNKFVTAQGMAFDLENNVAMTIEVRRRITDRFGKKYNDDMVTVTANAACAIALRNAIFRVVPKGMIQSVYDAAKLAAVGKVDTLERRRNKMLEHFLKMGVAKERIFATAGVPAIEDVDLTILEKLIGISTAIKDGEISVDEAFPPVQSVAEEIKSKNKTESLANKLKAKVEEKVPVPTEQPSLLAREPGEEG